MRWFFLIVVMTALSSSAFAQAGSVEQQIRDLDRQSREAGVRGDAAFNERILADDYLGINGRGEVTTRAQNITNHKTGAVKYESIEFGDERVRVYGDTAIVTGRSTVKATRDGQDISGQSRVTRVWVKMNGEWKLVSHQATRIADPSSQTPAPSPAPRTHQPQAAP